MGSLVAFVTTLRGLYLTDDRKTYYVSTAPQYPRPDASIPLSSIQFSIDFIWIQFRSADLSGGKLNISNGVTSPRIFIGAPAFAAAGSGYVDQDKFQAIMQSVQTTQITTLGGGMFWDAAYGEQDTVEGVTYMQIVKDVLG
jgi:chitinase